MLGYRAGLLGETLEEVQYWRGDCRLNRKQRLQAQVAWWMSLLGEQPLGAWVARLENLVRKELWLDDAYQVSWWYAVERVPEIAEYEYPEGGYYDGPGLLWDNIDDTDFGSATESRFWDLHYDWEDMLDFPRAIDLEADLFYLVTKE
ncbi:Hypothetical predicted protein [Pelobates cultripes]|uniref:Uncharacterized protein n=1 Tax=Pelobates cultripes TaxID=61616 RepID=A0AAD1SNU3_PELCU|nr:Hypothetical predicted protein [Pelobates cultripes]